MQNLVKCVGIGALCLLSLAGTHATRAVADEPVALHQSLKVKDTVQYSTAMKITWDGGQVAVEGNHKYTVKAIKGNGDVVIMQTDLGGKVDGSTDSPPGSPVTLTLTRAGKILTYKPDMVNPYLPTSAEHLVAMVDRIIFPDRPVKPGDSWTTEVDNPQVKEKKVTIKTTFVGMDKAGGLDAWKVKQALEADTGAGGKLTGEATALLDPANGQIIEADETIKGIPGAKTINSTGKIQRVTPRAETKAAP